MSIHKKLLQIQMEMPRIDKDSMNPHFKNKYASLAHILSIVLPKLNEHGLYQTNVQIYKDNMWILVVKLIDSETEQFIETTLPLLNTSDMQKMGSCVTYAHRYGLLPLLGIAPEMDDDGNNASKKEEPRMLTQMEQDLLTELKELLISEDLLIKDNFDITQQQWFTNVLEEKNFKMMPTAILKIKELKSDKS